MSEMVDRLARRLAEMLGYTDMPLFRALARAELEEMRRASDRMIRVGAETYDREFGGDPTEAIDCVCLLDAWEAMIDEALK